MGGLTRKKLWSIVALGAMIGLLLLPTVMSLPALAGGGGAPAAGGPPPDVAKPAAAAAGKDAGPKVEKGRDVYYKTEGIVSGAPAPKTADNSQFYPRYNFESRAAFVLRKLCPGRPDLLHDHRVHGDRDEGQGDGQEV